MSCKKDSDGHITKDIQAHVSVLHGKNVKQDWITVKALIDTSLKVYSKGNPEVTSVWFKSKISSNDKREIVLMKYLIVFM